MTKILHILSQIPAKTGSGIFFENIIQEFHTAGFEQSAVIGLPTNMKEYLLPTIEKIYPVLFESKKLPFKIPGMSDVMPYECSIFSSLNDTEYKMYKAEFSKIIKDALLEFQPDFVLTHHLWLTTSFICEVLSESEIRRPKIFAICHGTDLRQLILAPQFSSYVTEQCQELDGVFSLHENQSSEISQKYNIGRNLITIIGNGFNSNLFNMNNRIKNHENEKHELVFAGKLAYSKGLLELIKAFDLLPVNRFKLSIAGSGGGIETEYIHEIIRSSSSDISCLGLIPQNDLAELFKKSDILILSSFYEGLPLVLIEALATGLKVVVNELEGMKSWIPDAINKSGNIIYVKMPKLSGIDTIEESESEKYVIDLKDAILKMADQIEKRRQVPIDYYDALMEYSWTKIFDKIHSRIIDKPC